MAFIQCSLTGTALSWYIRLYDTYKQDWHAFVNAFKKQFVSQKNAYYAQLEALNLTKKDNETVRHFALKIQQLVENGWCNENAFTINLKCNEIFAKALPKSLKDFANKRQVKHTSTVLEPSIPFHTLVKLVDAEDIANDKIRTHDLALEVNNNTKQLQTQTIDSSNQEQLMFTQPRDPNNKNKPAYKNLAPTVIEQITPSLLASKNNEMMKIKEKLMLDQNLLKNRLYNTFVPLLMTEQKNMIQNIEAEVHQETIIITKTIIPRHRSTSRDRFSNDKHTTPPQYTRSRYDNYKRDSRSYRSPYRSSYRSPYRRDSRPRYRSRSYSRDSIFQRYTSSFRPPLRPRDPRSSQSRSVSPPRNKLNKIQPQIQNDPINFEVRMYHPTKMANAVTPTSWFFFFIYTHTIKPNTTGLSF